MHVFTSQATPYELQQAKHVIQHVWKLLGDMSCPRDGLPLVYQIAGKAPKVVWWAVIRKAWDNPYE